MNDDTVNTLTILGDSVVFCIQNLPVDVVTVVFQLFDKEVKSGIEARTGNIFNVLVDSEARLLFS